MTIARQNTSSSLPISIHDSNSLNLSALWKIVKLYTLKLNLFSSYIHAYTTIFGVMLLTLMGLIYLGIHHSLVKLLSFLMHRDQWNISSSK